MKFSEFYEKIPYGEKGKFAKKLGIKSCRLSGIAYGRIKCGAQTAIKIERATNRMVTREELAPHINWKGE